MLDRNHPLGEFVFQLRAVANHLTLPRIDERMRRVVERCERPMSDQQIGDLAYYWLYDAALPHWFRRAHLDDLQSEMNRTPRGERPKVIARCIASVEQRCEQLREANAADARPLWALCQELGTLASSITVGPIPMSGDFTAQDELFLRGGELIQAIGTVLAMEAVGSNRNGDIARAAEAIRAGSWHIGFLQIELLDAVLALKG